MSAVRGDADLQHGIGQGVDFGGGAVRKLAERSFGDVGLGGGGQGGGKQDEWKLEGLHGSP